MISLLVLSAAPGIEDFAVRNTVQTMSFVLGVQAPAPGAPWNLLHVGTNDWIIVPDCTPLIPLVAMTVAMISFPSTPGWRLLGIGLGAVVLWLFNVLRLVVLAWVERWMPAAASMVHIYLFQTFTFVLVCALFVLWICLRPSGIPQRAGGR
ncbi:MAG TPA: exosortase/archaeosortase family protein [Candidatus Polarisedimenticolia bacterium]|nr:exosortase/archaeosortase family protein [Candidatus Polarisedimenticolia bacterium]